MRRAKARSPLPKEQHYAEQVRRRLHPGTPGQSEIGCHGQQTQREPIASIETGDDFDEGRSATTSLMMSHSSGIIATVTV